MNADGQEKALWRVYTNPRLYLQPRAPQPMAVSGFYQGSQSHWPFPQVQVLWLAGDPIQQGHEGSPMGYMTTSTAALTMQ